MTTSSRMWLVIGGLSEVARVELNDAPLGQAEAAEITRLEITGHLKPTNLLSLTIAQADSDNRQPPAASAAQQETIVSFGHVALEIDD